MLTKVTTYCQSMVGQCVDSQTRGVYFSILHEFFFFNFQKGKKSGETRLLFSFWTFDLYSY